MSFLVASHVALLEEWCGMPSWGGGRWSGMFSPVDPIIWFVVIISLVLSWPLCFTELFQHITKPEKVIGTPECVMEVSAIGPPLGEHKTNDYSLRIKRVRRDFLLTATKECTGGNIQISGASGRRKNGTFIGKFIHIHIGKYVTCRGDTFLSILTHLGK